MPRLRICEETSASRMAPRPAVPSPLVGEGKGGGRLRTNIACALLLLAFCGFAAAAPAPEFGAPPTVAELAALVAIPPDGTGLPPGHGDPAQGASVYAARCVACHGEQLEGVKAASGPALIGGRGTLGSAKPVKTVESYWPYATTLFDYVRRAMPFNAPGTLSDDEVYAVSAYILARAHVIDEGETLDPTSLPKVVMPNRDGFYRDPRPR